MEQHRGGATLMQIGSSPAPDRDGHRTRPTSVTSFRRCRVSGNQQVVTSGTPSSVPIRMAIPAGPDRNDTPPSCTSPFVAVRVHRGGWPTASQGAQQRRHHAASARPRSSRSRARRGRCSLGWEAATRDGGSAGTRSSFEALNENFQEPGRRFEEQTDVNATSFDRGVDSHSRVEYHTVTSAGISRADQRPIPCWVWAPPPRRPSSEPADRGVDTCPLRPMARPQQRSETVERVQGWPAREAAAIRPRLGTSHA